MTNFSKRHGFAPSVPEITIWHDAPTDLRGVLVNVAYECGLDPHDMRSIVCRVLRKREDPSNWSPFPNVDSEVRGLLDDCQWFKVYDVIEGVCARLNSVSKPSNPNASKAFEDEMNQYFLETGIGWQLQRGELEIRGAEAFELAVSTATHHLQRVGHATTRTELREAVHDLSRRPTPDITGAIQHGLAAVECALRQASGDQKRTLGALLANNKGLVPAPMDQALEKLWGFASETGRHLREGSNPNHAEAELSVHVAAAVCSYLARRLPTPTNSESPRQATEKRIIVDDDDVPF